MLIINQNLLGVKLRYKYVYINTKFLTGQALSRRIICSYVEIFIAQVPMNLPVFSLKHDFAPKGAANDLSLFGGC